MTWIAPETDRPWVPGWLDERETLEGYLRFHRQTLLMKCAGLTGEELKKAANPPSTLTLLGLVRHMAENERWWFRTNLLGEKLDALYCPDDDENGDFDSVAGADAEADYATFLAETAACDAAIAGTDLDDGFVTPKGNTMKLRWVYMHVIEEYARHNGHADLVRESLDGQVGE